MYVFSEHASNRNVLTSHPLFFEPRDAMLDKISVSMKRLTSILHINWPITNSQIVVFPVA